MAFSLSDKRVGRERETMFENINYFRKMLALLAVYEGRQARHAFIYHILATSALIVIYFLKVHCASL